MGQERQGKAEEKDFIVEELFEWHQPSVVLLWGLLFVYLPKPQAPSGGQNIKRRKVHKLWVSSEVHTTNKEWTQTDSLQGVNELDWTQF